MVFGSVIRGSNPLVPKIKKLSYEEILRELCTKIQGTGNFLEISEKIF
jgi:hypothetical protein